MLRSNQQTDFLGNRLKFSIFCFTFCFVSLFDYYIKKKIKMQPNSLAIAQELIIFTHIAYTVFPYIFQYDYPFISASEMAGLRGIRSGKLRP